MKCVVCKNVLSGKQTKFCGSGCYSFSQAERQKANYRKRSPRPSKRACVFCGTIFQPRGQAHICCNKYCRIVLENRKRRAAPKKPKKKKETRFWEYRLTKVEEKIEEPEKPKEKPKKPKEIITLCPLPKTNSDYLDEIKEFEETGGEIQLLPPQLNGRTPDANLRSIWGWSLETMYGFGYEIGLMEALIEEIQDAR